MVILGRFYDLYRASLSGFFRFFGIFGPKPAKNGPLGRFLGVYPQSGSAFYAREKFKKCKFFDTSLRLKMRTCRYFMTFLKPACGDEFLAKTKPKTDKAMAGNLSRFWLKWSKMTKTDQKLGAKPPKISKKFAKNARKRTRVGLFKQSTGLAFKQSTALVFKSPLSGQLSCAVDS